MNKKSIIIVLVTVIIVIAIAFGATMAIYKGKDKNNDINYTIITNSRWLTMLNDGGSHTNIYYEIDLENQNVNKVTESYHANLGGEPKTNKSSDSFKIDRKLKKELQETLDDIFQKKDINENNNYDFYVLKKDDEEKEIYNEDTINTLEELIAKIENK